MPGQYSENIESLVPMKKKKKRSKVMNPLHEPINEPINEPMNPLLNDPKNDQKDVPKNDQKDDHKTKLRPRGIRSVRIRETNQRVRKNETMKTPRRSIVKPRKSQPNLLSLQNRIRLRKEQDTGPKNTRTFANRKRNALAQAKAQGTTKGTTLNRKTRPTPKPRLKVRA